MFTIFTKFTHTVYPILPNLLAKVNNPTFSRTSIQGGKNITFNKELQKLEV